jgi:hypothetical protein
MQNVIVAVIAAIMVSIVRSTGGYKQLFPIQQTQSAYHPRAQRNAFRRRDARQQSRSFAPLNQGLKRLSRFFIFSLRLNYLMQGLSLMNGEGSSPQCGAHPLVPSL